MPRALSIAIPAAFVAYYGLLCFRQHWGGDLQMYASGVARLYTNLADPGHEVLALTTQESSLYTPYLVLVAALGKLTGLTPYRALQLAGLANLVVYVLAVRTLFSRYSMHVRHELAAALFLFVSLCLRWHHFGWSSETSLTSFQFVQAYPSTLGWSLAFFSFAWVADLRRYRAWQSFALLTATLTALLTCHVLTASWALGIVVLLALRALVVDRNGKLLALVAPAVAASVLLASLWPYASFFAQSSATKIQEPSTFGSAPFDDLLNLYLVALPCALWLVLRARRHAVWVWGFAGSYIVLVIWRALGISFGNRYAFFMGFFAQFLVAEAMSVGLLAMLDRRVALRHAFRMARDDKLLTKALCFAALLAPLPSPMLKHALDDTSLAALQNPLELLTGPSPHDQYYRQYAMLRHYLGAGDVVIAPTVRDVFDIAAVTGARFISAPGLLRVPDIHERFRAAEQYYRPSTSTPTRAAIAKHYRATKALLPAQLSPLAENFRAVLGPPVYRDSRLALYAISPGSWR